VHKPVAGSSPEPWETIAVWQSARAGWRHLAAIVWGLFSALVRRWYVVVAAGLCAALATSYAVSHEGVYYSRVEVVFLAPSSELYPNSLMTASSDIVMTAGVVANLINGTRTDPKMASPSATIVGRGVVDGHSVRLPDTGGQWAPEFSRQVLDVQVVGDSVEGVRGEILALVDEIVAVLDALQEEAGVIEQDRIRTDPILTTPTVSYMPGARRRAVGMILVLSVALTLTVVSYLERRAGRDPSSPRPRPSARARPRPALAAVSGSASGAQPAA
jgi:hypothetical protein